MDFSSQEYARRQVPGKLVTDLYSSENCFNASMLQKNTQNRILQRDSFVNIKLFGFRERFENVLLYRPT